MRCETPLVVCIQTTPEEVHRIQAPTTPRDGGTPKVKQARRALVMLHDLRDGSHSTSLPENDLRKIEFTASRSRWVV